MRHPGEAPKWGTQDMYIIRGFCGIEPLNNNSNDGGMTGGEKGNIKATQEQPSNLRGSLLWDNSDNDQNKLISRTE